jgi:hypothetical protein
MIVLAQIPFLDSSIAVLAAGPAGSLQIVFDRRKRHNRSAARPPKAFSSVLVEKARQHRVNPQLSPQADPVR